jgi:hypothetical protein
VPFQDTQLQQINRFLTVSSSKYIPIQDVHLPTAINTDEASPPPVKTGYFSPLRAELAIVLNVSPSELQDPTPKGRQTRLRNALSNYLLANYFDISRVKKVANRVATVAVNDCRSDLQNLIDL